jgi:N-acetylneuraminic acid mutarotase
MKTKTKISGHILRSAACAVFFLLTIVALSSAFNLTNRSLKPAVAVRSSGKAPTISNQARALGFADRVAYQRAIEDVYWRHRIWPKANAGPKPSLEKVVSQAQIERKVEDYLRNSQALEDYWQRPITPDQLQAEMERIASHTKQPGVLRELFTALGNDPFVVAECLARPVLAERLITELYAHDQRFHGELKRRAEAELRMHPNVAQMKQTGGMYTEMEWVRRDAADNDSASADVRSTQAVKMSTSEWQDSVQKLTAMFGHGALVGAIDPNRRGGSGSPREIGDSGESPLPTKISRGEPPLSEKSAPLAQIKTGVLSPLQEDDAHYYAVAVTKKGRDRLKLATVAWLKEPLRSWVAKAETQVPGTMAAVTTDYTLPAISSSLNASSPSVACTDDTWAATMNAPEGRYGHTAVWTGSEMIIWGGAVSYPVYFNTGARYNPTTDSWTPTSITNAPDARRYHTAVWTGSQMIVWGGGVYGSPFNTGGKYNPSTDSWTPTSTANAPTARQFHTAVWTGSQMIVWGGDYGGPLLNTGGRYNPTTDTWTATSATGAPDGRVYHTAVWTGSEMIVWGGVDWNIGYFNTGGRYNPNNDSWTASSTTNAPSARQLHTAVWTGSQMIVWGGIDNSGYSNTGGRYNPNTDSWTATSTATAPEGRVSHTAVWTGSQMIVWGGAYNIGFTVYNLNTGGKYDPGTDSWAATSTTSAPEGRGSHTAVWTGSEMMVWGGQGDGGYLNSGGRYNPTTNAWTATSPNAPDARFLHTAVWTGSEMIVWGGATSAGPGAYLNTGGRYNPSTDSWTPTSTTNAPEGRALHTAVWTGSQMIIWGGRAEFGFYFNTGGRYNPGTDSWTPTSTTDSPAARDRHTAVWTGSEMIVWGGTIDSTGGRYNPSTDSWTATSTINAPEARVYPTAVWTGSQMIVWGGIDCPSSCFNLNTGGKYNPGTDSWTATSTTNAPDARSEHTAVWTGSEMIVWGGVGDANRLNTGGRYNPSTDSWTATSTTNAPDARSRHTAVWTGLEMIVWGGTNDSTGGRYNPSTDNWTATSTTGAPSGRYEHTAVWTGSQMIVWGGVGSSGGDLNTTGRYCAQAASMHPAFFSGEVSLGNGIYYLQFPNGTPFGYYSYLTDPRFIYHFDMGYEYWFDANNADHGIFSYDFASSHFFYTSPSFPFPYLYDFSLNTVLYYYPDPNNPGHYTTNPRYFYNFATGQIITM